jgi:hypothetical protein
MSGEYEIGLGRPPKRTQWKKGQSGHGRRRKARRAATTAEIIDKMLLALIDITENGIPRRVTTLEAILLQLWQRELDGNRRALAVRLKYEELDQAIAEPTTKINFADSPYRDASLSKTDADDNV